MVVQNQYGENTNNRQLFSYPRTHHMVISL